MTFIPTRIHAVLDFLVSLLVAALPFLFGTTGLLRWPFVALGAFGLLYSLLTDYEFGLVRVLPVPAHLALDVLFIGILLGLALASPWEGGLQGVSLGVVAAAGLLVLFTRRAPAD